MKEFNIIIFFNDSRNPHKWRGLVGGSGGGSLGAAFDWLHTEYGSNWCYFNVYRRHKKMYRNQDTSGVYLGRVYANNRATLNNSKFR
jgi:hypothetical protein